MKRFPKQSVKAGVKDGLERILETKTIYDRDPDLYEFDPTRVHVAMCCYQSYRWTCYLGTLTYLIFSIIYLVLFYGRMSSACDAQRDLWYYLLYTQCAVYLSTFANQGIRRVRCAKSYFRVVRHIIVTTISFSFGSYGTVVLANADQACDDAIPLGFRDLVYATDILAYITGLWFIIIALLQLYGVVGWLCRHGNKIKYSRVGTSDEDEYDNSAGVGSNREYDRSMRDTVACDSESDEEKGVRVIDHKLGVINQKAVKSTLVGNDTIIQDGVYRDNYSRYRADMEKKGTKLTQFSGMDAMNEQKKRGTQFGEFNDGLNGNTNSNIIQIENDDHENAVELGSNINTTNMANVNVNVTRRGATKNRVTVASPSLLGD